MALGVFIAFYDFFLGDFFEATVSFNAFRYLIGCPLGSWIMRKAMVPSLEVAGNILTGTRTRDRRRLPDQTGMGAMGDTRERCGLLESGAATAVASEQSRTAKKKNWNFCGVLSLEVQHSAHAPLWRQLCET
jgi:hypothetical protein